MKRQPHVAGGFYPDSKEEILSMFSRFESSLDVKPLKNVRAIIVPHAGYIYSGIVAMAAYRAASSFKGKDITLLGPSHYFPFPDVVQGDFESWVTPLGETKSSPFPNIQIFNEAIVPEHSLEVQVPFIQHIFKDVTIHPLLVGELQPGNLMRDYIDKVFKGLIVVSSDLSHYLPYEEAVYTDKKTIDKILKLDDVALAEGDACGREPIKILIHIARKRKWKPKLIMYKNSGDTAGPKSGVVGYSAIAFVD
jgi:AmmeMemoRadiSam system protein B